MNKQLNNSKVELNLTDRIELLNLSKKIITALKREKINTIEELIQKHEEYNLKKIRNIGPIGLKEVEKALIEKCSIRINKDISELQNLGLSTRALNMLIKKYKVSTIKELLSISLCKKDYYHLDSDKKIEKEIIDKIHELGYIFACEQEKQITLSSKLADTPIHNIYSRISWMTVGELLKLSLDPNEKGSLYRIRNIGPIKGQQIIDIIHSYGFVFECEKEENKLEEEKEEVIEKTQLTINDSIYDLGYYPGAIRNMKYYGIRTIEDLLKLSTSEYITHQEKGLYNIRGFGKKRVLHFIDYIHSLGFRFEDEKATLEKNNTLENLYRTFDNEFISREFYEKVDIPEDFTNNTFVLYFTKIASNVCRDEYDNKYTNKDIITFLTKKLMEHKKKMLCITNNISKKLELKK